MSVHEYRFVRRYLSVVHRPQFAPGRPLIRELCTTVISSKPNLRAKRMNLMSESCLRLLRWEASAVLEMRLHQAQVEAMAPSPDLLLSRTNSPSRATFAGTSAQASALSRSQKTLDNFRLHLQSQDESQSGLRLATAASSPPRRLTSSRPTSSGKSHLASHRAGAIQKLPVLTARPTLARGTRRSRHRRYRKAHGVLATVPLLIIDDLACASYPHAAEELLEIIMRRYERASTVIIRTDRRRLGQTARRQRAVTACSTLLHHGHVLKCGHAVGAQNSLHQTGGRIEQTLSDPSQSMAVLH